MAKRIGIFFLAATLGALCLEIGERFLPPGAHGFVATVEAIGPSSDARKRCGRCAQNIPTVRSGRVRLLGPEQRR